MIVIDAMEYATDALARAAWLSSIGTYETPSGGTLSVCEILSETYDKLKSIDGDIATRWSTNGTVSHTHLWEYDYGVDVTKEYSGVSISPAEIIPGCWGLKNFAVKGSNDGLNWDTLLTAIGANTGGYQDFLFSAVGSYRHYKIELISSYYEADDTWQGLIEVRFTVGVFNIYSESTIKQQGSYSLKIVAPITTSLNETVTHALSPTFNLSGQTSFKINVRSSRTGSNFKIGLHDSGGTTTEVTPNIASADTFQEVTLDLSAVSDANKDAIDSIIYTQLNADAETTLYLDYMRALSSGEGTGGGRPEFRGGNL